MNLIFQRCWPRLARVSALVGLASLALFAGGRARAQDGQPSEYQVKAAFLLNFGKFVEWPAGAFASANAPLVIGVFGDDPFHGDLKGMAAGQHINGHPVLVRRIKALADLKNCQILFIPAAQKAQAREVLKAAGNAGVLTVGETEDFIQAGGMINFIIEHSQVHFEINNEAARSAGLKISSKLLALARRPPLRPPE
jgi:YfiR/HmsC-like